MDAHRDQAIVLENCDIQHSQFSGKLEAVLKGATKILSSPKKLENIVSTSSASADSITLRQLNNFSEYDRVTVSVKVLTVEEKVEVRANLWKQDVNIADSSGTARLTLWETDIGKLHENNSYQIIDLLIKEFNGLKYLTPPRSGCEILPLDDIGEVIEIQDEVEANPYRFVRAEVAAVSNITKYKACISCKFSKVDPGN